MSLPVSFIHNYHILRMYQEPQSLAGHVPPPLLKKIRCHLSVLTPNRFGLKQFLLFFLFQLRLALDKKCYPISRGFRLKCFLLNLFWFDLTLYRRLRHSHNLIRHPISFLFISVTGLTNSELRLSCGGTGTTPGTASTTGTG